MNLGPKYYLEHSVETLSMNNESPAALYKQLAHLGKVCKAYENPQTLYSSPMV